MPNSYLEKKTFSFDPKTNTVTVYRNSSEWYTYITFTQPSEADVRKRIELHKSLIGKKEYLLR